MKALKILNQFSSFKALNQQLEQYTKNQQTKLAGDIFELAVKLYLQTNPKYRTKLKNVWLLKEVKENIKQKLNLPNEDEGIDLIAETYDNVPTMIEKVGIDVLDPVQWRCKGMDREGLARDFGDSLVFHGAMDNQFTLVDGSPDDARREAEENIRLLGSSGGYILGPCHNLQVVSPPENIVAMYEAGYECGWL